MQLVDNKYKIVINCLGVLFFSFFFYISWIYYKEKMLCFDPSFFSFLMIDEGNFSFALGRWGSALTQFIPLIALKNGCSLKLFLQLYAVSPILIYFLVFLIIVWLNNYRAALALLLSLCLGFRHAFYYTTAELYIGIALVVLFWAIIAPQQEYSSKSKKIIASISAIVLIYVMSYLHQLTLFAVVFVLAAEFIANNKWKDVYLWSITILSFVWFVLRIFILTKTDYESEKIPSLDVFVNYIPHMRYLPSTNYFKYFAVHELWPLFLVFFISWVFLFKMKKWLYAFFLPLYSVSFLILILITYYKGESPLMYENYYTLFGVFASLPFVYVLEHNFKNHWKLIVVIPLLTISVIGIFKAHTILTKRIDYISRLVDYGRKQESKKFLLHEKNFPWQYAWINWALPFETTLYSAIDNPDAVVTFFTTDDMNKYDSIIQKENVFLGPKWAVSWFGSNNLNKEYFHFPATGYKKLNTSQADSSFHEELFDTTNISIQPQYATYYCDPDSFVVVPIQITNTSGKTLASIPEGANPIYLTYHIYNKAGDIIVPNGIRTPLEVDIVDYYQQGLTVITPKEKGKYTIEIDLVTENKRWWRINSKFVLIVDKM